MFFLVSVCNNYAFDFNIPMPLHMIFRAVRVTNDDIFLFGVNLKIFFLQILGLVDCQHDHGNINFEEKLRILQIFIGCDDYGWNCNVYNSFWY